MKKVEVFTGKKVLVLGLAKSGYAAARLLHELGAEVIVNDRNELDNHPAAGDLQSLGMRVIGGGHPISILDEGIELIVKNPGIPYTNPLLVEAAVRGIKIITEVEIASIVSEGDFIGITGSNGKTTTTTLIFEMLNEAGKDPILAGNIGNVASEVAKDARLNQPVVIELSSFQLMGIDTFKPKIAVMLNLFDAHLDYHGTREEYKKAKARIFMNQTASDYLVLNGDDSEIAPLRDQAESTTVLFSVEKVIEDGTYIKDGVIYFKTEQVMRVSDIVLPGKHNLANVLAAITAAKLAGVTNEAIFRVLTTFTGVKHRLQYVETINGRKFYNDSKATNILATKAAISAFDDPIVLLAGGLDRGNDFDELIPYLHKVKAIVVFGQTANKISEAAKFAGIQIIKHVDNVEQAVPAAYDLSEEGDVILLSPACASWDQYKTFEQRGDIFVDGVHRLK